MPRQARGIKPVCVAQMLLPVVVPESLRCGSKAQAITEQRRKNIGRVACSRLEKQAGGEVFALVSWAPQQHHLSRTKTRTPSHDYAQDFFIFVTRAFFIPKIPCFALFCFCIPKRHIACLASTRRSTPLFMGARGRVTPFSEHRSRKTHYARPPRLLLVYARPRGAGEGRGGAACFYFQSQALVQPSKKIPARSCFP